MILVPEGRRLFGGMRVLENLEVGAYASEARRRRAETLEFVFETFPILAERRSQLAGTLSGGQQQMLAIGRALMGLPRLLLLDEPSLGLAPMVVQQIFEVVAGDRPAARRDGAAGRAERPPRPGGGRPRVHPGAGPSGQRPAAAADLLTDPRVRQAYLGLAPEAAARSRPRGA